MENFRKLVAAVKSIMLGIEFFITGSQAYGPVTTSSDLDIVVNQPGWYFISAILQVLGIPTRKVNESDTYDASLPSFYFNLGSLKINIIGLEGEEFDLWKYRTEMMKSLPPIMDKKSRVDIFKSFHPAREGDIKLMKPYTLKIPGMMPAWYQSITVNGFTYSQWKEANPSVTDEELLLNPVFAPFFPIIHAKKNMN
jgi:hypothetical protein